MHKAEKSRDLKVLSFYFHLFMSLLLSLDFLRYLGVIPFFYLNWPDLISVICYQNTTNIKLII